MDGFEMVRRYRALESERNAIISASTIPSSESAGNERDTSAAPALSHAASAESGRPRRALFPARLPMPIVGISANSNLISQSQATDAGMNAFLSKPFKLADLNGLISIVLSKSL
jgi:CheY-like chemotaxis protein